METRPYQNFWGKPKIGQKCKFGAYVEVGDGAIIGDRCTIEAFVFIPPGVELEEEVFVGPHACFTNDKFPRSDNGSLGKWSMKKTLVKKNASIGANVTIICGVTIGERAMIGAGSVVTKDVPDDEVWVGNPARRLKKVRGEP